ncbi:MAG: triose-phosphate isomerase [Alphaproteobacteria bacterium]
MTGYIVGNWKMQALKTDVEALTVELAKVEVMGVQLIVAPSAPYLNQVHNDLLESTTMVAGQDCSAEAEGAFTGDVSAAMLKDSGCEFVILGHSERRQGRGESNEVIRQKMFQAHEAGLKVILCVGECDGEDAQGILKAQLDGSLAETATSDNTLIAYEPVWAIGTGKAATPEGLAPTFTFIQQHMGFGYKCLYGGSVKPGNAEEIFKVEHVRGALIGGASLNAEDFLAIARSYC